MREIGFRANGLSYIPRRYCVARVAVIDPHVPPPPATADSHGRLRCGRRGRHHRLSWGVEWCVVGFDREHAYEPACAVLRPILERWLGETHSVEYGLKARY